MRAIHSPLQALIVDCQAGDARAQEKLYYQFYPYAISLALHYSSNRELAEEVVQDAYVKCFKALIKLDGDFVGNFKPWFRRILVNTAIDRFRAERKRLMTEEISDVHLADLGYDINGAMAVFDQQEVYGLLQLLPPAYRMVFNLHALEGFTHAEIAEELGINEGTSKSNLYKARKILQRLSDRFFDTPQVVNHG
ncbi:MAG: sigma-70 family RNA polymerase sigma factor [Bacteroidota bacterium]